VDEVLAGIDVDAAADPLGELAEVGGEMKQQIETPAASRSRPRSERSIAIRRRDEASARRVAGTHRES
jgi:hypothetical protein